jgi:hypothetical protein
MMGFFEAITVLFLLDRRKSGEDDRKEREKILLRNLAKEKKQEEKIAKLGRVFHSIEDVMAYEPGQSMGYYGRKYCWNKEANGLVLNKNFDEVKYRQKMDRLYYQSDETQQLYKRDSTGTKFWYPGTGEYLAIGEPKAIARAIQRKVRLYCTLFCQFDPALDRWIDSPGREKWVEEGGPIHWDDELEAWLEGEDEPGQNSFTAPWHKRWAIKGWS